MIAAEKAMGYLKKLNAVIFLSLTMLAVACKEDNNEPVPEDWSQYKCLVTGTGGAPFIYNASGKLVRINYPAPYWQPADTSHEEMTYNANGNIADKKFFNSKGEVTVQYIYTYNAANLPDTLFHISNTFKPSFQKFEYNAEGKLVRINVFEVGNPELLGYTEITYPAEDKSLEKGYYRSGTGGWTLGIITENHYDNKNHPYSQLGFYSLSAYNVEILISKHNIITSYRSGVKKEWSYNYNAQGYPLSKSLIQPRAYFSPYGSPDGEFYAWEYNCQ